MRWTNHFEHPGDNRYMVFTFANAADATSFRQRLEALNIPFEEHFEDGDREPHMFAVNKRHFRAALRENHLIKAATRDKFIPVAGFRWGLLIATAVMIGLAILGAFRTANAQGWEMALEFGALPAADALGASPISAVADSLGEPLLASTWNPIGGGRFAVRMVRPLNGTWRLATGLTVQRLGADWDLNFEDVDASGARTGVPVEASLRLRGVRYRLPILAATTVQLSEKQRLIAGAGLGLDFTPTDVFATGSFQIDSAYHDFRVAENRTRLWNVPLLAELGWEVRPEGARAWNPKVTGTQTIRGVYVGVHWSRELFRTRWGEATWEHELSKQSTRLWMGPTSVAAVLRFTLS